MLTMREELPESRCKISPNFSPTGVTSQFVARANIESEVRCQKTEDSCQQFATATPSAGESEVSEALRRWAGDRADVCQPGLLSQKPLIRVVRTNPDPQKSVRHINCDCAITCGSYSNRVNVAHFLEP